MKILVLALIVLLTIFTQSADARKNEKRRLVDFFPREVPTSTPTPTLTPTPFPTATPTPLPTFTPTPTPTATPTPTSTPTPTPIVYDLTGYDTTEDLSPKKTTTTFFFNRVITTLFASIFPPFGFMPLFV